MLSRMFVGVFIVLAVLAFGTVTTSGDVPSSTERSRASWCTAISILVVLRAAGAFPPSVFRTKIESTSALFTAY